MSEYKALLFVSLQWVSGVGKQSQPDYLSFPSQVALQTHYTHVEENQEGALFIC